jgi:hypothetical protein
MQPSIKHVRNDSGESWSSQHGIEFSELDGGRLSMGDMSGKITLSEVFQKETKGVLKQF